MQLPHISNIIEMGGEHSCLDADYNCYNNKYGRNFYNTPYTSTVQKTISVGGSSMHGSQVALSPGAIPVGVAAPMAVATPIVAAPIVAPAYSRTSIATGGYIPTAVYR